MSLARNYDQITENLSQKLVYIKVKAYCFKKLVFLMRYSYKLKIKTAGTCHRPGTLSK